VSTLRFDGRVAVVTGAGRGLGRAYASLLAERGASVVVNDLGTSMGGSGADAALAASVVDEISAAGGKAIADDHDVSTVEGAEALVGAALDGFGRVDALVANAGIMRWGGLPELDAATLDRHLAVHVGGSFHTARAAWSHFAAQGYGRIVLTTSAGVFGLPNNTAYATAKGGVIGLGRSLAAAGAPLGIRVNLVAPAAHTRMAGPGDAPPEMDPALVAPLVAYLAHEDCPVTGEIYTAGAGRFARLLLASTPGFVARGHPTVEDVAAAWTTINDESGYAVPVDLPAWSDHFLAHLEP
jgi:NAD(P)-dependent dehydrogenase (short-subunit alcohol dehydrogenase family)